MDPRYPRCPRPRTRAARAIWQTPLLLKTFDGGITSTTVNSFCYCCFFQDNQILKLLNFLTSVLLLMGWLIIKKCVIPWKWVLWVCYSNSTYTSRFVLTFQKWFVSFPNKNNRRADVKFCVPGLVDEKKLKYIRFPFYARKLSKKKNYIKQMCKKSFENKLCEIHSEKDRLCFLLSIYKSNFNLYQQQSSLL